MAIVDDDMEEVSGYSIHLDSLNSNPSEDALSRVDLARADSCTNNHMGASSTDWSSMKDILMKILSSQPGPLDSSSSKINRQPTDDDENLIVDDTGDAESINISEDDEDCLVLVRKNARMEGRSDNLFEPIYTEDIAKIGHLGSGLDLSLTTYEMEPSPEEIFKVWNLGIADELDVFSEMSEAFAEIPLQIQSDDPTSWEDLMNIPVDGLIAGVGHLSLIQRTK